MLTVNFTSSQFKNLQLITHKIHDEYFSFCLYISIFSNTFEWTFPTYFEGLNLLELSVFQMDCAEDIVFYGSKSMKILIFLLYFH